MENMDQQAEATANANTEKAAGKKPNLNYHRHNAHQVQRLEAFYIECQHPDEKQRRQLSRELGLEAKQIKFWFQNKRTQTKTQNERADNNTLRADNDRILCENNAIKEALQNVICPSCGGPPFGEEERKNSLQKLQQENARLKDQHEKISDFLAKHLAKPLTLSQPNYSLPPMTDNSHYLSPPSLNYDINNPLSLDHPQRMLLSSMTPAAAGLNDHNQYLNPTSSNLEATDHGWEKSFLLEIAMTSMEELIGLVRINDPLWVSSPLGDGRYVINRDIYDKLFPRTVSGYHLRSSGAHMESSKAFGMVSRGAVQLVDMFLDSNKWADLFHSIVASAHTIQVLDPGMDNRSGSLRLVYEKLHILSPLVPPREFYILRYCEQMDTGIWVILDVSYDIITRDVNFPLPRSWRYPSGCIIQETPNGCSKISWVEHVEVDDKTQTDRLFRDLLCNTATFGAERWVYALERMCERFSSLFADQGVAPFYDEYGTVISIDHSEGRRSLMKLSQRMVKDFCGMLSLSGKLDLPQTSDLTYSGIRVSVRQNTEDALGQPNGLIISASSSLWLPVRPHALFDFFLNDITRPQWDVMCHGNPVQELAHISNGNHPGNSISVIRPFASPENHNMVILQESWIDPLGSMIVFAPLDMLSLKAALSGFNEDCSDIQILPSGFTVSEDGRFRLEDGPGSILTVAFQVLVSSPEYSSSRQLGMETVGIVNTLISSTVQKIKEAFNYSGMV